MKHKKGVRMIIRNYDQMVAKAFEKKADVRGYTGQVKADYLQETTSKYKETSKIQDGILLSSVGAACAQALHNAKKQEIPVIKSFKEHFGPVVELFKNASKTNVDDTIKLTFKDFVVNTAKKTGEFIKTALKTIPKPVRLIAGSLIALIALNYHLEQNKTEAKYDAVQYIKDNAQ